MTQKYSRAPLTEAAIEIRISGSLSDEEIKTISDKYARLSWKSEDLINIEITVHGGEVTPATSFGGRKFTNAEATEIVQIHRQAISFSRLPPYENWDEFVSGFVNHWRPFRKRAKQSKIVRIGVRYINRIDVPTAGSSIVIGDYLTFHALQPTFVSKETTGYSIMTSTGVEGRDMRVNLQSQLVPAPLIGHVSITLDIDLFREGVDLPQSDTDIVSLFEEMRAVRTQIFEECITDKARALFS